MNPESIVHWRKIIETRRKETEDSGLEPHVSVPCSALEGFLDGLERQSAKALRELRQAFFQVESGEIDEGDFLELCKERLQGDVPLQAVDRGFGDPIAGEEAEELRQGIDSLLANGPSPNDVRDLDSDGRHDLAESYVALMKGLQKLLDETDARDSLAFLQRTVCERCGGSILQGRCQSCLEPADMDPYEDELLNMAVTEEGWLTMDMLPSDGTIVLLRLDDGRVFRATSVGSQWENVDDGLLIPKHRIVSWKLAP